MTLREDQFIERGNGLEVNGEAWLVEIIFFFFFVLQFREYIYIFL